MTQTNLALDTQQSAPQSPMQMIQRALDVALASGEGLTVANLILEQMRQQREYEDKAAFNSALQRIQSKLRPIARDLQNPGRGKYASARAIDDEIVDLCNAERMILSFNTEDCPKPDTIRLVCDAGIEGSGYTKRYFLDVPADGSGPKGGGVMNRTQATGSAVTSGKRYIKNMIFNLRIREKDDDGNAAGKMGGLLDERRHVELRDNITNAGNKAELQRIYLAALSEAEKIGDAHSIKAFIAAKQKRLGEL